MYKNFNFEIIKENKGSRLGILKTPHGEIKTPAFIFCATKGAVKGALDPEDMVRANTQFILSNTYHLFVNPGPDLIKEMGGLHNFMKWRGPILTDSGGFQIFSLGHGAVSSEIKGNRMAPGRKTLVSIKEEGATFRSYLDGSLKFLSPETAIQIQNKLGSDIVLVLDECTPFHVSKDYTRYSMHRSHRWELRSLLEFERITEGKQALYGIVQGGIYQDLRRESVDFVNSNNFFGIAIGGSLGSTKEQMYEIVNYTTKMLDKKRPVHLLGIGGIKDIFNGVKVGIDSFDCVHPTRVARHGGAIVKRANKDEDDQIKEHDHINLRNSKHKYREEPIDKKCECYTCKTFSTSYLHYLLKADELLVLRLITIHNVYTMNKLMGEIREAINNNSLEFLEKEWI